MTFFARRKRDDAFTRFAPAYDRFMQIFRLYRLRELRDVLSGSPSGGALLDVAGGTGFLSAALAGTFNRVVVADISSGMLAVAQRRNLETVCAQAESLPFADATFDAVLCADALHHIKSQELALNEIARVLKPGGTIVIQEFHIRGIRGFFFFLFERLFIDHSTFIAPDRLAAVMAQLPFSGEIRKLPGLNYIYRGTKL